MRILPLMLVALGLFAQGLKAEHPLDNSDPLRGIIQQLIWDNILTEEEVAPDWERWSGPPETFFLSIDIPRLSAWAAEFHPFFAPLIDHYIEEAFFRDGIALPVAEEPPPAPDPGCVPVPTAAIVRVQTEIRSDDWFAGVKTMHYAKVDSSGTIIGTPQYDIGLTGWIPAYGQLTVSSSGPYPFANVVFSGYAASHVATWAGGVIGAEAGALFPLIPIGSVVGGGGWSNHCFRVRH